MKACNRFFLIFACSLAGTLPLSGASTLKKTDSSAITMPSMPSGGRMSMPQIGSGFYVPGSKGFYSGSMPAPVKKSSDKKADDSNKSAETNGGIAQDKTADILNTVKSAAGINSSILSASDLASMDSMGLLGSVSGLFAGNKNSSGLLAGNESSILVNQNSQDSKKLESILNELSDLKAKVEASGTKIVDTQDKGLVNKASKLEPKILRFNVNGQDLRPSFRKVYFSDQESDGTFLLTGDRKFIGGNRNCTETFYFFFHTKCSEGGITKYKVTPAVSQDAENTGSYLYQLMQKNELEAERTGNLVTLRAAENDWKMDILISLDK